MGSPSTLSAGDAIAEIGRAMPSELVAVRQELDDLQGNVERLIHEEIPPTDFTEDFKQLDMRLRVLSSLLKGSFSKRDQDAAQTLRNRLMGSWAQHNRYVRSAKADLEG